MQRKRACGDGATGSAKRIPAPGEQNACGPPLWSSAGLPLVGGGIGLPETNRAQLRFPAGYIRYRRSIMDDDRTEGSMKTVKGRIKEGVGKAVGDSKLESEGKMDKAEGKIQNTIGGIKDSLRKST